MLFFENLIVSCGCIAMIAPSDVSQANIHLSISVVVIKGRAASCITTKSILGLEF